MGTPEQPATDGLCKWCEIDSLKAALREERAQKDAYKAVIDGALDQLAAIFPSENKICLADGIEKLANLILECSVFVDRKSNWRLADEENLRVRLDRASEAKRKTPNDQAMP